MFYIIAKIKYLIHAIILRKNLKRLEFHVVDHCNLNCNGCLHFSNISEKNFLDINLLKDRLQRLSQIFGKIDLLRILGGEPLLHPHIINIIEMTRNYFPFSKIDLVTNGLLLNKMSDDFFNVCYKNKIVISISNYIPLSNNIKKIKINYYILK